jgi:hypothetical protein
MSLTSLLAAGVIVGLAACAESPTGPAEQPPRPQFANNVPCPDGFQLAPNFLNFAADKNNNGAICIKSRSNSPSDGYHYTDDKLS